MQLYFDSWIKNQNVSERTLDLLNESIICYRAQAYKAAYLFSFLSFQNILKERILRASKPRDYKEELWLNIQKELRDDDKWETKVIECVERKRPGTIFDLSDDVKHQYFYWKDRRNDCAHAKGNKIGASHVESFWLFFESNLSKFGVGGGKEALIERLNKFFDLDLTPREADPIDIVNDIPYSIKPEDYRELFEIIDERTKGDIFTPTRTEIWHQLFNLDEEFREHLVEFLKTNRILFQELMEEDLSKLRYFHTDAEFIRSLWKGMKNTYKTYIIIIGLLRHRLIPENQMKEMVETVSENNNDTLFLSQVDELDLRVLEESGFFHTFKELAFVDMKIRDFNWARENRNIISHYIIRFGFDEILVKALNNVMTSSFIPWKLRDSILDLFVQSSHLKDQYKKINEQIGGLLPDELFEEES